MLLAKSQYLAVAVNFVRQNAFRITAIALPILSHRPPEVFRIVDGLKVQLFEIGLTRLSTQSEIAPFLIKTRNRSTEN